ncbi:FAD-dependent oxidoreductase, partial [Terrisporobacter sp.]|uniref:FAD-dependent oxidoreductase n=1 Tax=Terrisporobacter sp. TaxID=1965305 RepID=UPI0028A25AC3
ITSSRSLILLDDNKNVKGVELGDNSIVECDLLIIATGVRPNTEIVANTNIEDNRGIVINDKCETTVKDVYAAGDVVGKNAIWPLAVKQGIVAAYNMAEVEKIIDDEFTFKNSMNFVGIPTVSLGIVIPPNDTYDVITRCDKDGYKKFVIKDNVITGFVAQGDISYTGPITYLIKHKVEIPNLRDRVFDIGYADFYSLKANGEFEYNI